MELVLGERLFKGVVSELAKSLTAKDHPLDRNLQVAIRNYTHRRYGEINQYIRSEVQDDPKVDRAIGLLDQALEELDVFEGEYVYRWTDLTPELKERMVAAIGTGELIYEEGYTSTSGSEFFIFEDHKEYHLTIKHKDGRRIDSFSYYPQEEEVLIPSGSWFKILSYDEDSKKFTVEQVLDTDLKHG